MIIRGPWLMIGIIFKALGWKSLAIVTATLETVNNVKPDPETIQVMANLMGLFADSIAVVAFIISIAYYTEKRLRERRKKRVTPE